MGCYKICYTLMYIHLCLSSLLTIFQKAPLSYYRGWHRALLSTGSNKHSIIGGSRGWHRALLSTGSTLHTASLVDPGGGTELCYPLAPLYTQHHWWIQGVAQSFVIHWLHSTHSVIGGSRGWHRALLSTGSTLHTASLVDPGGCTEECAPFLSPCM